MPDMDGTGPRAVGKGEGWPRAARMGTAGRFSRPVRGAGCGVRCRHFAGAADGEENITVRVCGRRRICAPAAKRGAMHGRRFRRCAY